MNWNSKAEVIRCAWIIAEQGPSQVVYKRQDRVNYNICHLVNLQRTIDLARHDGVSLEVCLIIAKGVKT